MPTQIITTLTITHTPVDDKHSIATVELNATDEAPVPGPVLEAMFDTYLSFLRENKVTIENILSTTMRNFAKPQDNMEVDNAGCYH